MTHTLADVLPSVAAALHDDGDNPLAVAPARDIVVLLVDGLGARLLERHRATAPTLAGAARATLRAGFPATTATSITSLAVGAPCAVHGIIGYSFGLPADDGRESFNALRWRTGGAEGPDARQTHPPEQFQPVTSAVQHLAADGVGIHYVVPGYQMTSGLTRAAFRAEGALHAADDLAAVRAGILEVVAHDGTDRRFAYAYHPALDMNGHLFGAESPEWLAELARVEAVVADLMTDLPTDATLLVTGDHGMVNAGTVVDLDGEAAFRRDVELIAGEARVRHVYAAAGAVSDVADRWRGLLGSRARVATREQALDEGWFGQSPVGAVARDRIGDLVVAAQADTVMVCPADEPLEPAMAGHHGSWTDDEQLVPLIASR
ncbi:alkaline phosphatase family protein [Gordonia crocea]|uniref:alkaline phosphatase family protein n=1 Tax=Gordonia crocea TaxID=589162 RepID=UPI001379F2F8|nr:nucleotide pyrophosphatase/phosphodiesterase family protein [Gordonia crocea]